MLLNIQRKISFWNLLGCMSFVLLLGSCNSTRFVPQEKYLLNRASIRTDSKDLKREELKLHVHQKENLRILGFLKFHLGVYNLSSKTKENDWLKKIGEAPVLYDELQTQKSKEQLQVYLKNKGYYNAVIKDSVVVNKPKKKVDLIFLIKAGQPYRVRNCRYDIDDKSIESVFLKDSANQLLKTGDVFDLDVLNSERQRIVLFFKNRGYYKFAEDFVSFQADSNLYNHQVDLTLRISRNNLTKTSKVPYQKYKIKNYIIYPDYKTLDIESNTIEQKTDTLKDGNCQFIYSDKLRYKPLLFYHLNRLQDSIWYCVQNAEKTYQALNRLKQFKLINISFNDAAGSLKNDSIPYLDCKMQLSPLPRQNFSVDVEGTNSSGNLGVAGNLNYQQRNVFRGAEVFDIQFKGARERQNVTNNTFNTKEFGVESSLTIPKFLLLSKEMTASFQNAETKFTVGYNYQNRPDYTRTISNLKIGYDWKSSKNTLNTLNLVDLNYVKIYDIDSDFLNSIEDLYIKYSYTDHLVFALNYTWLLNTQNINKREDYKYFKIGLESAGSSLELFSMLTNKSKKTVIDETTNESTSYYEILKTRFAQYVKGDFEYRYGHFIDKTNSIVGRAFFGIGVPFGNFNVLPFEKKYFTGGANGIRAWQVRSLGPGSYKASSDAYPNESSDIKLEGNIEYRFKLFWRMEGAFFTDAGNIWAINNKDNREGSVFRFDRFYKQIAVGTGLGLRFDFTYFLFRLDLGMKIRDPSLPEGKRFIIGNYPITSDHFNLSFAIGYPF
jgi:outer membrane protein assembly factor BamA